MPPASLSTSHPTFSSSSSALISLYDWWLIKSEDVDGKRLAVGGYYYPCEKTMYVFTSATIVKRVDLLTVENADGYTLRLYCGINRSRSEDNGFPPEVLDNFFLGFPYNWEYYAKQDFGNDPMVPRSAAFLTSCASKPNSPLDDMVIKKSVSSPVNTDVNGQFSTSETISRYEKDGDERCAHLISTLNMNYENQNETRQKLQVESFSNKRLEMNNEKIDYENTFDSFSFVDDVSPLEGLSSLRTQQRSQQEDNISNMDHSPPISTHRNTDNNSHAGVKDSSTISSPLSSSLRSIMKTWKPIGLNVKPNRVEPPNDDSDVPTTSKRSKRTNVDPTFHEESNILPQNAKGKKANDTKIASANVSLVEKNDSDCNLGRAGSKHNSDNPETHCDTWIRNHDDINNTVNFEEIKGITSNLDENQNEAMHEPQVNNYESMKANKQKKGKRPSISEEKKSPLTRCKTKNLNTTSPTSPELVNPRRSRSGRLLLPSVEKWQREIIYDKDGSVAALADIDKLASPTGSKSKKSRR